MALQPAVSPIPSAHGEREFGRERRTTCLPVVLGPEHERSEVRRFRGPMPRPLNRQYDNGRSVDERCG